MLRDSNDLGSLLHFRILVKKRTLKLQSIGLESNYFKSAPDTGGVQAVYMTLEFVLLTTEHEADAILDTKEFKEVREDTLVHRGWDTVSI